MNHHKQYLCIICELCLPEKVSFDNHMALHKLCDAQQCHYKSKNNVELRDHVKSNHPNKHFPCDKCDKVFEEVSNLYEHHKTHKNEKKVEAKQDYPCDHENCAFSAINVRCLVKHILEEHINPSLRVQCDECDYNAEDINVLNTHKMSTHNESEEVQAKELLKTFFSAFCEAMVETNDNLKNLSGEMSKNFIKVMDVQGKLMENMEKIKVEVGDMKMSLAKEALKAKFENKEIHEKISTTKKPEERATTNVKNEEKSNKKEILKRKASKKRVTWVGTSISNVMDGKKFEQDCNVKLKMEKAYCINKEEKALYKEANFKAVVPKVIDEKETDILVLQTGSIEITDLNINEALKDTPEKIQMYKKEWFEKVEKDSTNLFDVAEAALAQDDTLEKVLIVKRLQRYDRGSKEVTKIKSDLSEFANSVYDQLWLKRGSPEKIQVLELNLKCSESKYLKSIIFGNPGQPNYDGVHLRGKFAGRHFTYRAVQAIKSVLERTPKSVPSNQKTDCGTDCPQQRYQRQFWTNQGLGFNDQPWQLPRAPRSQTKSRQNRVSTVGGNFGKTNKYNVPTSNFWNPLNC